MEEREIVWTAPALDDLDDICAFIARDNPAAAARLSSRVMSAIERLTHSPESGRWVPELLPNKVYREVIVRPCRVVYRREGQNVLVVMVFRSERLLRIGRLL
ncbi:MAG: type II toxin-antitoxin system RelE/ParE family toxin [Polyangiaceae bacterium]|nr:type II toxin-antitoxin system RelE/ParE family toxin [Polyangiaceae bacterium]